VVRAKVPDPSVYDGSAPAQPEPAEAPQVAGEPDQRGTARTPTGRLSAIRHGGLRAWLSDAVGRDLPKEFFRYAAAASLTTGGLVTFGIIGYHLSVDGIVPVAGVPVVYAGAMAVEALAALAVGAVYDRRGAHVLLVVPVLVAAVPALALTRSFLLALVGVAVWGLAFGIQDSTIKALVAEIVPAPRRATAYGVFAGIQGAFAVVGGALVGWLYDVSLPLLVAVVAATQLLALVLLVRTVRVTPTPATADPGGAQ
jgi:hypothetical protein